MDTDLKTTAQTPEPAIQPAPETLGEMKEGDEEDEHPSGRPPSPAQPERENTRQQEEREEGNPTANQATETALTEPEPGADPPAESREATKANPPPQGAAGEEGLTPTDKLLVAVYGDHIRTDDGSLLDGGIATDRTWQSHWWRMTHVTPTHYSVPKGAVGWRFLMILTNEFHAVRVDRKANLEKPLVFVSVILPKTTGIRTAKDIHTRLTQRMDLWNQGCYTALMDDTEAEALGKVGTSPEPDEDTRARAFNARVLSS